MASGFGSVIPGGINNVAAATGSFATGTGAHAIHDGAIVFADSGDFNFTSTTANQFIVRATGDTTFVSAIDASGNPTAAIQLFPGEMTWSAFSDIRSKDNIAEYTVLDKLDNYRAVEWDWKSTGNHDVGVIAQELESIFPDVVNAGSSDGEITGIMDKGSWSVQYSKLGALALQAIKEQQVQIDEQQNLIDSLIAIICADDKELGICKGN